MSKRVGILLAEGFEETEAVAVIDVLRRAELEVETLGVERKNPRGSHGITVEADALLGERAGARYAMIVLPGGMPGAATLRDHPGAQALVRAHAASGAYLAAICAAPIALARAGALEGKRATCYPGFEDQLGGAVFEASAVVRDGRVVTSRGPGTALLFALALVEALCDRATAAALEDSLLVSR